VSSFVGDRSGIESIPAGKGAIPLGGERASRLILSAVWPHCTPAVRRALAASAPGADRLDTRVLLGALVAVTPAGAGGSILRQLAREEGVDLPRPDLPARAAGSPPERAVSPTVRETLSFFRMHHLRPITAIRLAVRLLEIGTGEVVQSLEAGGRLSRYLRGLRAVSSPEEPTS